MAILVKLGSLIGSLLVLVAIVITFFKSLLTLVSVVTLVLKLLIVLAFIAVFAGVAFLVFKSWQSQRNPR